MRNSSKNMISTNYSSVYHRNIEINRNLFGHARRRKTTDRLIQQKVKLDRASAVKVEIENQLRISLYRNRAHEATLFDRVAKINLGKRVNFAKEMLEKLI